MMKQTFRQGREKNKNENEKKKSEDPEKRSDELIIFRKNRVLLLSKSGLMHMFINEQVEVVRKKEECSVGRMR